MTWPLASRRLQPSIPLPKPRARARTPPGGGHHDRALYLAYISTISRLYLDFISPPGGRHHDRARPGGRPGGKLVSEYVSQLALETVNLILSLTVAPARTLTRCATWGSRRRSSRVARRTSMHRRSGPTPRGTERPQSEHVSLFPFVCVTLVYYFPRIFGAPASPYFADHA